MTSEAAITQQASAAAAAESAIAHMDAMKEEQNGGRPAAVPQHELPAVQKCHQDGHLDGQRLGCMCV